VKIVFDQLYDFNNTINHRCRDKHDRKQCQRSYWRNGDRAFTRPQCGASLWFFPWGDLKLMRKAAFSLLAGLSLAIVLSALIGLA